ISRRRMIADSTHHVPHSDVIGIGRILRHEPDVRGYAGRADRGGEIAALQRALLAFRARRPRDEADRRLHRRDIGVALAVIRGEYRDQRELLGRQRGLPRLAGFRAQVHLAGDADLAAADAQSFHFAQRLDGVAAAPEHHADFQVFQSLHSILSPFLFLDSSIARASRTAIAESSGGQRSGFLPALTQPAKYSSSASNPSRSDSATGASVPSARYSVSGRPAELNSRVPPSLISVNSMEKGY